MNQKLKSMLGMAHKAGKLQSGNYQVEEAVKSGKGYLVLISQDSSDRSIKSYTDMCKYYHVCFYIDGTKDEISQAIGKVKRGAICITDENFAETIKKLIDVDKKTEDEAWQK